MSREDDLIAHYFAPLAGEGAFALTDDAAMLTPSPGHDAILTVDALVAGVHFLPDDPPASIARKALGVNLSDLAAKGASPRGFLLSLALPAPPDAGWIAAFAAGLGEAARDWGCPLLGGDTTATPGPLTLSITAIGEVPTGRMLRRLGARPGDWIGVTGTIGDAALGLRLLTERQPSVWPGLDDASRQHLIDRYRHPRPRLALAPALRDFATAAMDVSDGLIGDLMKLLRVSGVAGVLDRDAVPLSAAARAVLAIEPAGHDITLTGGDDYEILFAIAPETWNALETAAVETGIAISRIGSVMAGEGLTMRADGQAIPVPAAPSYDHFRKP